MGREYYKARPYSARALDVIAKHYNELKQRLCPVAYGNYSGRDTEDIFGDTICVVIQDEATKELKTDEEILKLFEYRFKMVAFQVIRDNKEDAVQRDECVSSSEYEGEGEDEACVVRAAHSGYGVFFLEKSTAQTSPKPASHTRYF